MKSQPEKLADVAGGESDLADCTPSKEQNVTLVRAPGRGAVEGPLTTRLLSIGRLRTIGDLRRGRMTERPVSYGEDEAVTCDCNSSTAASSRRTRARSSTTSS